MRTSIHPGIFSVVVLILGLLIFVPGCQGENSDNQWIEVFHKSDRISQYTVYYDKIGIDCHEPKIIRFWIKEKYFGSKVFSYSLYSVVTNYEERTYRILDVINYDLHEKALPTGLSSRVLISPTWVPVIAGSDFESVINMIDQKEFGGFLRKIHEKQ